MVSVNRVSDANALGSPLFYNRRNVNGDNNADDALEYA